MDMKLGKKHRYYFTLKNPQDIYNLATIMASSFPQPDEVFTGIYELLLNAVEHGNLGISFEDKYELLRSGRWQEEVSRRLSMPEHMHKTVNVEVVEEHHCVRITIVDEGEGFNWKEQFQNNLADTRPHGRGLWIAQQSGFDYMAFNPTGNAVTCQSSLPANENRKERAQA